VVSPLPSDFISGSQWLVQAADPHARLARLIQMADGDYRTESFLDDRMLAAGRPSLICSLDELVAAANEVDDPPAAWIFHIGHVGSTLMSRLLGELDGVLAIREPRSLRDLGESSGQDRLLLAKTISRLMARRGPSRQLAIVKATSSVSEHAPQLVEPEGRALFLYASPANYVATILAGENSRTEVGALHEIRMRRAAGRGVNGSSFNRNDADRAALAWACEMTSIEAASDALGDRQILWADFDQMLVDMTSAILGCAQHFGLVMDRGLAEELANGPLMRRYSKALEYDYSPSLRAELLAEATQSHRSDIEGAMEALRQAAQSAPLLDRALQRSGQEC